MEEVPRLPLLSIGETSGFDKISCKVILLYPEDFIFSIQLCTYIQIYECRKKKYNEFLISILLKKKQCGKSSQDDPLGTG